MESTGNGLHLISMVLFMAAAACVYLFLLNRRPDPDARCAAQERVDPCGWPAVCGRRGRFGLFRGRNAVDAVPAAILAATALGEVRRLDHPPALPRGAAGGEQRTAGVSWRKPDHDHGSGLVRYEVRAFRPGAAPTLRIAHVSDFHLNSHLPLAYFAEAMHRVADAQPDLIFFTGDFVTDPQCVDLLPGILSLARGRLGTFGVLGNHDDWAGRDAVATAVRSAGVTLLGNAVRRVTPAKGADLLVCGLRGALDTDPLAGAEPAPGQLALMLTHTPDNVYRLSRLGFAAIFAGHYHGGQIRVPGLGSLVVPSNYGRRFDHGHFVVNGTHLFVTAGVGSAEPPLRLWCQPDVFIVDIEGQHG